MWGGKFTCVIAPACASLRLPLHADCNLEFFLRFWRDCEHPAVLSWLSPGSGPATHLSLTGDTQVCLPQVHTGMAAPVLPKASLMTSLHQLCHCLTRLASLFLVSSQTSLFFLYHPPVTGAFVQSQNQSSFCVMLCAH